jgi:hypothetical protein
MRDFFRGWRRKAGLVTLVMACGLASLWVRSVNVEDAARFSVAARRQLLRSAHQKLEWHGWKERNTDPPIPDCLSRPIRRVTFVNLNSGKVTPLVWIDGDEPQSSPRDLAHAKFFKPMERRLISWSVPYWCIASPLTLLAAYLLLWKPRKRVKQDA